MRSWTAGLLRIYVAVMCVWLLAPIVIVLILAFSGDGYLRLSAELAVIAMVRQIFR